MGAGVRHRRLDQATLVALRERWPSSDVRNGVSVGRRRVRVVARSGWAGDEDRSRQRVAVLDHQRSRRVRLFRMSWRAGRRWLCRRRLRLGGRGPSLRADGRRGRSCRRRNDLLCGCDAVGQRRRGRCRWSVSHAEGGVATCCRGAQTCRGGYCQNCGFHGGALPNYEQGTYRF